VSSVPAPPSDHATRVRQARPEDLPVTARLHERRLPGGFFARLGARFLTRYHATFGASPDATLLVAERDGRIDGFLAGTVHNARHWRFVARRFPIGVTTSGVAALLRDAQLAAEFVRTRTGRYARALARQVRGRVVASAAEPAGPAVPAARAEEEVVAVLTHVAVAEEASGTGAGRALVDRFLDQARAAGAREARLVTAVRGGGPGFYRRLGWRSRGRRRASDGTVVEEFVRPL
jgi:ribosomal protein S18 acetylase RimI-like enzyme